MIKIKLPNLNDFISRTKKISPLEKFYDWLVLQLPHNTELGKVVFGEGIYGVPEKFRLDVSSVIVHKNTDKKLMDLTTKWASRTKLKGFSKKYIDSAVAFLGLDIGPRQDYDGKYGVPEEEVWIKNNYLKDYRHE